MRIGVYGDSFASIKGGNEKISWFNLLTEFIPNAKVTSYGIPGSSVFYSYRKFLETYEQYDTVIFLVTEPNRYTKLLYMAGDYRYINTLHSLEQFIKNNKLSDSEKEELDYLKGWFIMSDETYNSAMTEFMLGDIESKKPNTIFFPCFPNSITIERQKKIGSYKGPTMAEFHNIQSKLLNLDNDVRVMKENTSTISCHFSKEFNLVIARAFTKKIKENVWNWDEIYATTLPHGADFYYTTK